MSMKRFTVLMLAVMLLLGCTAASAEGVPIVFPTNRFCSYFTPEVMDEIWANSALIDISSAVMLDMSLSAADELQDFVPFPEDPEPLVVDGKEYHKIDVPIVYFGRVPGDACVTLMFSHSVAPGTWLAVYELSSHAFAASRIED